MNRAEVGSFIQNNLIVEGNTSYVVNKKETETLDADQQEDTPETADTSGSEAGGPQSVQSEKASLRDEVSQITERLQRQAAEFQNYRRRTEQEKSQMVLFGKSIVIQQLLDVFDDFYRSIEAANEAGENGESDTAYSSLKSGVELAYQKLMDELKKIDVEPIDSVGQPFDEELHEAVMQQPVQEDEEVGIVLSELQRGYRMGDRILRHSKVIVSVEAPRED